MCRCETLTWTGSGAGRCNEDYALAARELRCAVLVDGATGLTKAHVTSDESDAAWFARSLARQLVTQLSAEGRSPADAFLAAGRVVACAYRSFPGADELERIDQPNGSVAALRWQAGTLEVCLLGDCTAIVVTRDGSCVVLHDDTLTRLDEENYARMFAYATRQRTTMAEARRALNDRFVENRLKMNEPDGYWAADISCRGMAQVTTETFSLAEVRAAVICSDGYANAVDMGVVADPGELARRVCAGEGALLGEELRGAERKDAGCWRTPRSKTSDDATYLCVSFDG